MKNFFTKTETKEIITAGITTIALILAIIFNIIVFSPKTEENTNTIESFENSCSKRLEQSIKYLNDTEKYENYKDILKIMAKNEFLSELNSDTELHSTIINKELYVEHIIEQTFKKHENKIIQKNNLKNKLFNILCNISINNKEFKIIQNYDNFITLETENKNIIDLEGEILQINDGWATIQLNNGTVVDIQIIK